MATDNSPPDPRRPELTNGSTPRAPIGPRRQGCATAVVYFIGFAGIGIAVGLALYSFGGLLIFTVGVAVIAAGIWWTVK